MDHRKTAFSSFLPLVTAILFLLPSNAFSSVFTRAGTVMGTDLEVTVSVEDEKKADEAYGAVKAEMMRIEEEMSEWKDTAAVSKINRNAGIKHVKITDELYNIIFAALQVSIMSEGAFDISWASMRGLWDFRPGRQRVPAREEVRERLPLVNFKNIELDHLNKTVFLKKKGMMIGLGAVAKGYAVDMAMKKLNAMGIKDAIVRAGGDMRVQGVNEGRPWEIGIRHPREKEKLLAALNLTNISISTSGDYERYFVKNGVIYHHIMDPKTGYPARRARSVTIIGPDTMTTDALSTAIFVLGPGNGMELVKKLKGIEAIIVDSAGAVHASPGIQLNQKN